MPHGLLHLAVDVRGVGVLGLGQHLDARGSGVDHLADRAHQVLHLRLDDEDRAGVADAGVGPGDDEEVGEAGHGRAEVGAGELVPDVREAYAVAPAHVVGDQAVGGVVAGGEDDHVEVEVLTRGGDDARLVEAGDAVGAVVQGGVRRRQRGIERVGQDDPLAADRVVRRDLGAQLRVRHLGLDVAQGLALRDPLEQPAAVLEADDPGLELPVDRGAQRALEGTQPQQPPLERGEDAVRAGEHPVGAALEDVELRDLGLDRGDDLGGARARPDDRDPLAGEVDVVVPAVGVEGVAREVVEAGERRHDRRAQRAGRVDDEARAVDGAVGGAHGPGLAVPLRRHDLGAEDGALAEAVLVDDVLGVGAQLGLLGVHPGPGVGLGGDGVERGGHVDGGTGVGVLAPGAAHEVAALEDADVGDAAAQQVDGGDLAAEAAADDEHRRDVHPGTLK